MDRLITVEDLRQIFNISEDIGEHRLSRHIAAASRELREWVGDEAYDDAVSAEPTDESRAEDLELAEAHLAMHFAILGLNTALRPTGIVKTERVENQVSISYHSPSEIVALQQAYMETAESLARPYTLVEETTEVFGVAVGGSSETDCEAITRSCY